MGKKVLLMDRRELWHLVVEELKGLREFFSEEEIDELTEEDLKEYFREVYKALVEESEVEGLVVRGRREIEVIFNGESFVLYVLRLFGKRDLLELVDMSVLKEESEGRRGISESLYRDLEKVKWITKNFGKYVWKKEDEDKVEGVYVLEITPVEKDLGYDEVFTGYYVELGVDEEGNVERNAVLRGVKEYGYERDWYTGAEHWEEEEWEEEIRFLKDFKFEDFTSGKVDDLKLGVDFEWV